MLELLRAARHRGWLGAAILQLNERKNAPPTPCSSSSKPIYPMRKVAKDLVPTRKQSAICISTPHRCITSARNQLRGAILPDYSSASQSAQDRWLPTVCVRPSAPCGHGDCELD